MKSLGASVHKYCFANCLFFKICKMKFRGFFHDFFLLLVILYIIINSRGTFSFQFTSHYMRRILP